MSFRPSSAAVYVEVDWKLEGFSCPVGNHGVSKCIGKLDTLEGERQARGNICSAKGIFK